MMDNGLKALSQGGDHSSALRLIDKIAIDGPPSYCTLFKGLTVAGFPHIVISSA